MTYTLTEDGRDLHIRAIIRDTAELAELIAKLQRRYQNGQRPDGTVRPDADVSGSVPADTRFFKSGGPAKAPAGATTQGDRPGNYVAQATAQSCGLSPDKGIGNPDVND